MDNAEEPGEGSMHLKYKIVKQNEVDIKPIRF